MKILYYSASLKLLPKYGNNKYFSENTDNVP